MGRGGAVPGAGDPGKSANPENPLSAKEQAEAGADQTVDLWRRFQARLASSSDALLQSYISAWASLEDALDEIGDLYRTLTPESDPASSLATLERLWQQQAQQLLLDPAAKLQRQRPVLRAVLAVQSYDRELGELAGSLPQSQTVTNGLLISMAGPTASASWDGRLRGWRSSRAIELPWRDTMAAQLALENQSRLLADGDLQLVLAQAAVHLLVPWQAWREQTLSQVSWTRPETHTFAAEREWWRRRTLELKRSAQSALAACRTVSERTILGFSRALLRAKPAKTAQVTAARQQRRAAIEYWARQQRAVDSLFHLARETVTLASHATAEIKLSLDWLREENESLHHELTSVIDWLGAASNSGKGEALASFPAPEAGLISAADRTADLRRRIHARVNQHLPATIELLQPRLSLPPLRPPWQQVEPARLFLNYLDTNGLPVARTGFRESEAAHQPIVAEIERAREVIAYGIEESSRDNSTSLALGHAIPVDVEGDDIATEAAKNALSLLEHREQERANPVPQAENYLCQALAVTLLDTEIAVERSWLGVWAHVTRKTTSRAAHDLLRLALLATGDAIQIATRQLRSLYQKLLVLTGWAAPPMPPRQPVENILKLRTVLELDLGGSILPGIYNRLFRLEPVEDPRFLLGREAEMAGLEEAKIRWQGGAAVAVMLVGSRGSGKTSLLNCAATRVFTDVPVVSGSFSKRLSTPAAIRDFLHELLGLDKDANVIEELNASRRVIILEEFERTFLRKIGGFAALDEFLRILDATAQSNLWIVSMNQTAFRFLRASTRITECFSTRINAASVSQEALVGAILQRHNLSGFRLHFEPPANPRPQWKRLRELLGMEENRQQQFFTSLYEQAQGNFRSAYELWRDSIERVEGGVVYARQPLDPDYRPLMRELTLEDNFVLHAVMQHGSLTTEEVAQVLRIDHDLAWRRLRRMQDLEILEPEPARPGYRVRPQATRFARETLYTSNLLTGGKS